MSKNELIAKIKAEIERLKKAQEVSEDKDYAQYELDVACGYDMACDDILSFLDTIEKSEKPMNLDFDKAWEEYGKSIGGGAITVNIKDLAKYFYELGLNGRNKK